MSIINKSFGNAPIISNSTPLSNNPITEVLRGQNANVLVFDSNWFDVGRDTVYTINHNLNMSLSSPFRYVLYYSSSFVTPALGSSLILDITGQGASYNMEHGYSMSFTDANSLKIRTGTVSIATGNVTALLNAISGKFRLFLFN